MTPNEEWQCAVQEQKERIKDALSVLEISADDPSVFVMAMAYVHQELFEIISAHYGKVLVKALTEDMPT